jgi:hypothetical protein
MAGGLLNLVSTGQENIVLNGNPTKTFFTRTFAQYTNFGLQKFRVDYEGAKTLRLTEESTFMFKIPRYAELLMDTYISVNLPDIWSPIFPPQPTDDNSGKWAPYEFRWIQNLGAKMVKEIAITCGNYTLQKYSGDYLLAEVQRDFSDTKRALFDQMTGNTCELNDPANCQDRVNMYPNAFYTSNVAGAEPSIRGRTLYIPLNNWFGLKSQMAFPLVSLQYNELQMHITFRPVNEIFQIRDVMDQTNDFPYIAPNFNTYYMQFHRFLQSPPDVEIGINSYSDTRTSWNADIHLNCTYGFLSNDEQDIFAKKKQKYLIKQVHESVFHNVTGANRVELDALGMVSSYLFYLQRSDANLRNEWSNYTNWPYNFLPHNVVAAPDTSSIAVNGGSTTITGIGPGVEPDGTPTGLMITGVLAPDNVKNILVDMGILLDGEYRENIQAAGVYNYVEKYTRTPGNAPDGLYSYNFCLNTSPYDLQPSGAINMSRFNTIEFEFNTVIPALDPLAQSMNICDPATGLVIGVNKPSWRIYDYNFDLRVFEERYNVIYFMGGNVGMMYAT